MIGHHHGMKEMDSLRSALGNMHHEFRPFSIEKVGALIKAFLLDTQKLSGTVSDSIEQDGAAYIFGG